MDTLTSIKVFRQAADDRMANLVEEGYELALRVTADSMPAGVIAIETHTIATVISRTREIVVVKTFAGSSR
jgi:hypothetical protein